MSKNYLADVGRRGEGGQRCSQQEERQEQCPKKHGGLKTPTVGWEPGALERPGRNEARGASMAQTMNVFGVHGELSWS